MRVAVSSDHRGFGAKSKLKAVLTKANHSIHDFGCDSGKSCDYPDLAIPAAQGVSSGQFDTAILFCGTGIGMSISANKVSGIRAAVCHDEVTVELARKHNDANVLCLPADLVHEEQLLRMVEIWLRTEFEGGRHARRVGKIADYENAACTSQEAAG